MLRGKSYINALDLQAFATRSNQVLFSTDLGPMVPLVDAVVVAAEELEEVQLAARLVAVAPLLLPLLSLAAQQHRRRSRRAGSPGNNGSPKPPKPRWSKRKRRGRTWLRWPRNLLTTPDEVLSSLLRPLYLSQCDPVYRFLAPVLARSLLLYQNHVTLFACITAITTSLLASSVSELGSPIRLLY